jgi:hypothetical protein
VTSMPHLRPWRVGEDAQTGTHLSYTACFTTLLGAPGTTESDPPNPSEVSSDRPGAHGMSCDDGRDQRHRWRRSCGGGTVRQVARPVLQPWAGEAAPAPRSRSGSRSSRPAAILRASSRPDDGLPALALMTACRLSCRGWRRRTPRARTARDRRAPRPGRRA